MPSCIGIDPGMQGGIAIIQDTGRVVVTAMPVAAGKLDWQAANNFIISNVVDQDTYACIERTFQPNALVHMTGLLEGLLTCLCVPVEFVAVQTWRKQILGNYRATKSDAVAWCLERHPEINLKRTPKSRTNHDGMAEAICIAEYCKKVKETK